jgi:hypothetical protein
MKPVNSKEKQLLSDLASAEWLTAGDLSEEEARRGTRLQTRGLCEWRRPEGATENRFLRLYITEAGRKAIS